MKLARIVDPKFHAALEKLANQALPLKVAFRLKGIVKTVQDEFTKYEEVRQAALMKYGMKDGSGNLELDDNGNTRFDGNSFQEFAKELGGLINEEIEVPTIKLAELGDNITITLQDIQMLDGLIVED